MTASNFLENLSKLKTDDLDQIKGFGPILAKNLVAFTNSDRFNKLFLKLQRLESLNLELSIKSSEQGIVQGPLLNQTICITGSFEESREKLKSYFANFGASITDSVTKKTTILLVGSDPGSKVVKAQELGISIFESVQELKDKFGIQQKTQT